VTFTIHKTAGARIPRQALVRLGHLVARGERIGRGGEVSVIVTTGVVVRRLNGRYRKKGVTTDVLSFRLLFSHASGFCGEVYIDHRVAARQARDHGHSYGAEITRLTLHGLLHVCGHDHHSPQDSRRMSLLEERYLRSLKLSGLSPGLVRRGKLKNPL